MGEDKDVKGAFGWDVSKDKLADTQRQYNERTDDEEPEEVPTAESGTYEGADDELLEAAEDDEDEDDDFDEEEERR